MRYSECPLCGKKRRVELYCDCDKGGVIGGPDLDQLEKDAVLGAAMRAAFQQKVADYGWPEDVVLARTVGVGLAVMSAFADRLEQEARAGPGPWAVGPTTHARGKVLTELEFMGALGEMEPRPGAFEMARKSHERLRHLLRIVWNITGHRVRDGLAWTCISEIEEATLP